MRSSKTLLQAGVIGVLLAQSGLALAGTDGDGIADAFDNCMLVPNADQRDTDGDGFGNICDPDFNNDLIVNIQDVAVLKSVFLSSEHPDQDLDGDGSANFFDLGILKSMFLKPPGPAGEFAPPGQEYGMAEVDVLLRAEPFCSRIPTHELTVEWNVIDADPDLGYKVSITAIAPAGGSETQTSEALNGVAIFPMDGPYGGVATVITTLEDTANNSTTSTKTIPLPPCEDRPVPVPADLGFTAPPVDDPPIIGVPDSPPSEVDIVHLGGSPFGPTQAKVVAAAGTGSGVKLFSYGIDIVTHDPVFLQEEGPFAGLDVKLHVLSPEITPKLSVEPFVQGIRRDDGNLWLTSWQVFDDGSFKEFDQHGYGSNAEVVVEAYAIAHRVLDGGNYQVVTPIRSQRGNLRTITWEVDRNTGEIVGRSDSGPWGDPDADTELTVTHLEDDLYVVSYEDSNGRLASRYWSVSSGGTPSDAGGAVSGLDHFGTNTQIESIDAVIDLPITSRGFVTPSIKSNGDFEMHVWETRNFGFDEGVVYMPYQVADNTLDQNPGGFGISLTAPTPTNATDGNGLFLANVRALLTDGSIETGLGYGVGDGELFSQMPLFELTSVHLASVTKVMTLLIAVEAIMDGEIALDDVIEVSAAAAATGGSTMNLDAGEFQTLETLLHGMMLRSGNDASAAIAEHISGNGATFAARMTLRASELGMNDTVYNETSPIEGVAAAGGTSTPQDQVTLMLFANELPLFAELASVKAYDACGETAQGAEKCYFLNKFNDSGYPGLESWKNGNLGFFIPGYSDNGGPYCVGSGCLLAQANRLDRDMITAVQQSGNRWGDSDEMMAYGFRQQFTPDHLGPVYGIETVQDFALDGVLDTLGVTVVIESGGDFKICSYALFADSGSIDLNACDEPRYSGVAGSQNRVAPTRVDGARISTLLADGDFWTAKTSDTGWLSMDLWRVGTKEP